MIAIFGQGKIGKPLEQLLGHFSIEAKSIDYHTMDDELFEQAEQIIVHQAIKPDHEIYTKYADKVVSELNFIGQFLKKQARGENLHFVGITGTDGKSTVSHILYELLKGLHTGYNVWLSGNFDESVATTLNHIVEGKLTDQKHIIVCELSSFLLHGLNDMWFEYSIWTNLSPDHLNRHPNMKDYVETKYRLFQHSTKAIFATQGVLDALTNNDIPLTHSAPLTVYGNDYPLSETQFVGAHNAGNIQGCFLLVKALIQDHNLSISEEQIHTVINTIKPLAHRMELINEKGGIRFYDDGKSTSSQSLRVALETFPGPIVLIAGGSDKGDSFGALAELMAQKVKYGVFLGTTAPQFIQIAESKGISHDKTESMQEAVKLAYENAQKDSIQVVVLSPGCASFDMFKDYKDRAEQFIAAVNGLS